VKVVLASAILLVSAAASGQASADDKAVCLDASTQGQTLRNAHRLVEARDQLRICARRECPGPVQRDCGEWLEGVERSLPTVVLSAKDASGGDLIDVTVTVDGGPLVKKLDGEALPMNPGPHAFRFELADGRSATQQVLVKEGEKARAIAVVLGAPATQAPPTPPPAPADGSTGAPSAPVSSANQPGPAASTSTGKLVGAGVSGAVGVAGVVMGIYFLAESSSLVNKRNQLCPDPNDCNNQTAYGDDGQARNDQVYGFVGLGVGVVGLGVATWLLLTSSSSEPKTATSWEIGPMVARDGGGLRLGGSW
jgi:hypothetical protein